MLSSTIGWLRNQINTCDVKQVILAIESACHFHLLAFVGLGFLLVVDLIRRTFGYLQNLFATVLHNCAGERLGRCLLGWDSVACPACDWPARLSGGGRGSGTGCGFCNTDRATRGGPRISAGGTGLGCFRGSCANRSGERPSSTAVTVHVFLIRYLRKTRSGEYCGATELPWQVPSNV
jgi:hypothetical protein